MAVCRFHTPTESCSRVQEAIKRIGWNEAAKREERQSHQVLLSIWDSFISYFIKLLRCRTSWIAAQHQLVCPEIYYWRTLLNFGSSIQNLLWVHSTWKYHHDVAPFDSSFKSLFHHQFTLFFSPRVVFLISSQKLRMVFIFEEMTIISTQEPRNSILFICKKGKHLNSLPRAPSVLQPLGLCLFWVPETGWPFCFTR